jgi:hypothetical protein
MRHNDHCFWTRTAELQSQCQYGPSKSDRYIPRQRNDFCGETSVRQCDRCDARRAPQKPSSTICGSCVNQKRVCRAAAHSTTVLALVGGKSGAFGGAGLTAATCSRIVISDQGRISVSGIRPAGNRAVATEVRAPGSLVDSTAFGRSGQLVSASRIITRRCRLTV